MLLPLILSFFAVASIVDARLSGGPWKQKGENNDHFFLHYPSDYDYVKGNIWPTPQKEVKQNVYYTLDPENFDYHNVGQQSDVLIEALTRYKLLTFPDAKMKPDKTMKQILTLQVKVLLPYQDMSLRMDEGYELIINAPDSTLVANTCWGALRGLESFSQLVHQNISGYYHAQGNHITDWPRFHHRGFLIDSSRHFLDLKFIFQFLDALAYSKYNVLHWHIVDDEGFPFVSRHFPDLSNKGSRGKKSRYSPSDVQRVIDYARFRGIRVLPEFDTPGHTRSWASIPDLLTPCYSGGKPNGNYGPVNPTKESTYTFLKEFFGEVGDVFPDQYLHLGGDEVSFRCWASNPDILAWMAKHNMSKNFDLLEEYYEQRLLDIVSGLGKKYVIWQDVYDNKVKVRKDTVVNVWLNWKKEMAKVTSMGYTAILSNCWYLDYISYGTDWVDYYKCDPHDFEGTDEQKDLVIGGTAALWGEFVDGTNLIPRAWARGMSIGGRLWSSKDTTDLPDAALRMWEHRCRYLRRGLNASEILRSKYCRHEWLND